MDQTSGHSDINILKPAIDQNDLMTNYHGLRGRDISIVSNLHGVVLRLTESAGVMVMEKSNDHFYSFVSEMHHLKKSATISYPLVIPLTDIIKIQRQFQKLCTGTPYGLRHTVPVAWMVPVPRDVS